MMTSEIGVFGHRIAFSILSHGPPEQLQRLIGALNREYDNPQIACHHDFGQSALNIADFSDNVRFVEPYIPTGWGRFSVVQAGLAAIDLLYSDLVVPDWFIHLSAADYPVMPGQSVRDFLAHTECDAFLDARPIDPTEQPRARVSNGTNSKLTHFESPDNQRIKRLFYTSREFWFPVIRKDPKIRLGRHTFRPGWKVKDVYDNLPAFFGDHWFCGNAKTARILLSPTTRHMRLQRHLRNRTQTDETYFQTVLMNEPSLTVCTDNKRFAEWNGGGAHPMLLTESQVDEALTSGAFFARKFEHGSIALDRIDAKLASTA